MEKFKLFFGSLNKPVQYMLIGGVVVFVIIFVSGVFGG
jgi:hypothetical protein